MNRPLVCADVQIGRSDSDHDKKSKYLIMRSFAALAGVLGSFFCFVTSTDDFMLLNFPALALTCIMVWAVSCTVMSLDGKKGTVGEIVQSALTALAVLIAARRVISGGSQIITRFYEYVTGLPVGPPRMSGDADTAICVIAALVTMLVCYFTVRRPNLPIVVILTFPLPEICLYFGLVPIKTAFAALMMCYAATGASMLVKGDDDRAKRAASQSAFSAAVLMLCALFVGGIWSAAFGRSEWADRIRDRFNAYFSTFTWEKFSDDVQTAFSAPRHELTHDGRLGSMDEVKFEGTSMLEVTAPSDAPDLYIKGFTGSDYNGSRWTEGQPVPELTTRITSPEFFPGRMLRYAPSFSQLETEYIAVTNKDASPHTRYYPYNSAGLMESDGKRRQYWVYLPRNNAWQRTLIREAGSLEAVPSDMQADERAMREYAYKYCLDIPPSFTAAEDFFEGYEGSGIYDELAFIRYKLSQMCEYTLDSGRPPFGSDFAQWFMTENHKGSCTHFATSAVLLARSRGIPARYCEGFIVKSTDIEEGVKSGEYSTVSVPDSRAHAWAEIYIDNYGWLCFECTPGYGNMSSELPEVSGDDLSDPFTADVSESELTEVTTEAPEFTEDLSPETTAESAETTVTEAAATETSVDAGEETTVSTSVSESGTEQTSGTMPMIYHNKEKEPFFSEELLKKLAVIVPVLSVVFLIFAVRHSIYARRRNRIYKQPVRASAEIYHMLLAVAKENGIDIEHTDDTTAETLGKLFNKKDAAVITNTAVRARFAGGVNADEASRSDRAFARIMERYLEDKTIKRIVYTFLCKNKYS